MLSRMGIRKAQRLSMEAAMHGLKIEMPASIGAPDAPGFSDEEKAQADAAMARAIERKIAERGGGGV